MSDDLEGFDPYDDGESLLDDEAGRNAIAHLREQGELWPDLAFGPVSGQPGDDIHFAISRQTLKAATDATNLTLRAGREDVKLTVDVLSAGALRLTTSKRSITCRVVVGLEPNPKGIPEGGVRFSILRWSVTRLIAPKDPGLLRCHINFSRALWLFRFGRHARIRFTIMPAAASSEWELQTPELVTSFDPRVLREGLVFVRLLAPRKPGSSPSDVVEVRDGRALAGKDTGIAVFEHPGLAGIRLRVAAEDVAPLAFVLSKMLPAKTQLLETQTHQIIKDDAIECIVEKPKDSFPPIEQVLHKSVMGRFQFNRIDASMRVALLTALARERNGSYDLLLHLERDHVNPDKIQLKVHRDARWEGSAKLFAVARGDESTLPSWDGTVDLKDFVRVISYQLGPDYVDCFVLTQKVLLVSLQKDQSVAKAYLSFHAFNIAQPNDDSERNESSS